MNCPQNEWLNNQDYLRQFNRRAARLRIPLSGSVELTRRCNLKCTHCYLSGSRTSSSQEMDTSRLLECLEDAVAAGCLNLLITGGEPLLHSDFLDIYRRARKLGLIVSVFTNGTLLTDSLVELFQEFPPRQVEISLYGATQKTYESITGVDGSYHRCREGIRRLRDGGVTVDLKTILMTCNRHELEAMRDLARELGTGFRFDPGLFPCLDGNRDPLRLRIPPEEAVACDLADESQQAQWIRHLGRSAGVPAHTRLFECGAARTHFHLTPTGWLQPCMLLDRPGFDLRTGSFREGWEQELATLQQIPVPQEYPCSNCPSRMLCPSCPALAGLECGSGGGVSDYLCEIGKLRTRGIEAALEAALPGNGRTA